ncbi:MAG: metallophosphoesterase family protein [Chloroflexi bacterium]|jgi:predicted phosphodiesterase|nr:metallophosphoesterase family protein [Anaerolineaceae bacterium]NLI44010.1 metallophosphoesterase family protein [Chloroflexota bacterium]HOE34268.1 metallophosphoesterase family protein [Anaerolineaceae bacterium]HOT25892.1 metallophosphoesterase family protein [Anaerolineaceae bacterium]HQH58041.1 metallophosphoesterase family protein [Anaerolineaceae bacterium]
MRTLVISDVHSNADALKAVIADAGSFERVWCLGDVVGYGPDPNECIQILKDLPEMVCILGNHDAAVMGFIELEAFNHEASAAIRIQERLLNQESREFLELLDVLRIEDGITLAHGSPRNPIWEYVMNARTAKENFLAFDSQVCLIGHSHIPVIFIDGNSGQPGILLPSSGDMWRSEKRFLLNPGSVGQPRDRDPRASYVIWDDDEQIWSYHRVSYDFRPVQERILALGIPSRHAYRLAEGV